MKKEIDFSHIKKILVAKLRHHGDVLLTSPVFSSLKKAIPHASIDAYLYKETFPMLEGHSAISSFLLYDKSWKKLSVIKRLSKELKLIHAIRKGDYDLVINLTEGDRGAIAAKISKCKYAVGFDPEGGGMKGKKKCFTHIVKHSAKPRHTVEKNLDALRCLGIHPAMDERKLFFHIPEEAKKRVNALLDGRKNYIHLHPVSRWLFKCLPTKTVSSLIRTLDKKGFPIVVTASPDPDELKMIDEILSQVPEIDVLNLGGKISLKELGAVIDQSALLISVDSVTLHLSSALQKSVVALFGPTSDETWSPWHNPKSRVVAQNYSCRPCFRPGCGGSGVSDCLETMPVETIMQAVDQVLHRNFNEEKLYVHQN